MLAGDAITFADDTNIYAIAIGVAASGTIVLAHPGPRQVITAAETTLNNSVRIMAFFLLTNSIRHTSLPMKEEIGSSSHVYILINEASLTPRSRSGTAR